MSASTPKGLALYRNILRASYQFEYYNFRQYFLRRTRYEFRKLRNFSGDNSELYNKGLRDLALLRRQSMISEMFPFEKLVVERVDTKHHEVRAAETAATPVKPTMTTSD